MAGARFGVVALVCAVGCNGILGIHAPSTRLLDGGVRAAEYADPSFDGGVLDVDGGSAGPSIAPWAEWPMPNPSSTGLANAQSYEVGEDGVVLDQVTHLEWQRDVDDTLRTRHEAEVYCRELPLDGGGFRLPARIELLSLIDFTSSKSSIDTKAFGDTPAVYFWSASYLVGRQVLAWLVNFGHGPGFMSSSDVDSAYSVRCVRAADSGLSTTPFEVDGEVVDDASTQLTWQRRAPDGVYSWDDAEAYCAALDLPGGAWRLPTIKELMTIVDERHSGPAIDRKAFAGATSDYVWTSSPLAGAKNAAWAVSFHFGFDASFTTTTEQHVRCVRAGS